MAVVTNIITNPVRQPNDILIPDDINNPGINNPGINKPVQIYYFWYYRVVVRDKNGTLSGVEMYDSYTIKVATSNKSGEISCQAGKTTSAVEGFIKTFTFKKFGYEDKVVKIEATRDEIYTPVVMSPIETTPDKPVYFDIFVKDRLNDS